MLISGNNGIGVMALVLGLLVKAACLGTLVHGPAAAIVRKDGVHS